MRRHPLAALRRLRRGAADRLPPLGSPRPANPDAATPFCVNPARLPIRAPRAKRPAGRRHAGAFYEGSGDGSSTSSR